MFSPQTENRRPRTKKKRQWRFEKLESRLVFSGQAVIMADYFNVRQNDTSQQTFDVLANDQFDPNYPAPRLITSVSYGSQGGRIQIAGDRKSILYSPPADFFGEETFVYSVDGTNSGFVRVNIQAPLAVDPLSLPPDGVERQLDVLANDPFWEDYTGPRVITSVSVGSEGGAVRIAPDGRSIFYTVSRNAKTKESFIYVVDGLYPSQVIADILPVVRADAFDLVQHDPPTVLNVLANDPFFAGYTGERKITHVFQGQFGGTIQIAPDGKTVTYTLAASATPSQYGPTSDSFRYVVDGLYEATVSIAIFRPVRDDWFEVDSDSSNFAFDVTNNDYYYDSAYRYHDVVDRVTAVTQPAHGTVTISEDGRGIVYTAAPGYAGDDSFKYTADGKHLASVNVLVSRPVRDDYFSVYQDTLNKVVEVLSNDFRGNGYTGPRLVTAVGPSQHGGTIIVSEDGKRVLYTPADGYIGPNQFTYTVDGTLTATVNLTVLPLATNDDLELAPDPNHAPYVIDVLANDGFRRGYSGPGVITSVELVSGNAEVAIQSGNQITFRPAATGNHLVRYTVDGKYTATLSVYIKSFLDADRFVVDQNSLGKTLDVLTNDFQPEPYYYYVKFRAEDYPGPRLITGVTPSAHGGTVTIAADGKSVSYAPPADFAGEDTFTYTVDGLMTTTVAITVIRRVRDDQFRVDATDGPQALPVLVNDLFGADYSGPGQITAVSATTRGGTVVISNHGQKITYTPAAGFVGTDTFVYTVDGTQKAEVRVVVDAPASTNQRFASLSDFAQFLIDDGLARYANLFGQANWWISDFYGADDGFTLSHTAGTGTTRSHSETNVQVAGVDEADIVEFDSDYVYMLLDRELVIVDAWPADGISVASRFQVDGRAIAEFLHGDRLTIISEVGGAFPSSIFDTGLNHGQVSTVVTVLDVSNRAASSVVQKTYMDGRYAEARAVGDFVYALVQNSDAAAPMPLRIDHDNNPDTPSVFETREQYIARLQANAGEIVAAALPHYSTYNAAGELVRTGLLNSPEDIFRPLTPDARNLISVISFNVESNAPGLTDTSAVYSTGAGIVYASLDNFYVFDTTSDAADGAVTRITKFDWDPATGGVEFVASTTVAGRMINQFSADEHGEFLRIATTTSNRESGNWSGRSENVLFVLHEDGGVFEYVSALKNLAVGESMRSVRFMGDRAFITTFRDIDPLFAIDLSDPLSPEAVGHVTLPGYSSYMQLIDANHLLTVGRNTPAGASGPTQVSLFDISDLHAPRRIAEYTFERFSTSEAELDHHAFGYYAELGLLAMPVSRDYVERVDLDGDGYKETWQAVREDELAIFSVNVDAATPQQRLALAGQIEHNAAVRRSGFIGDKLYSIATNEVKVVDVSDLDTVIGQLAITPTPAPALPPWISPFFYNDIQTIYVTATFTSSQPPQNKLTVAISSARTALATSLGLDAGAPLLVSAEVTPDGPGGGYNLVFRVGERHYLYRVSRAGNVQLIDDDFAFAAAGAWHAVDLSLPLHAPQLRGDYNFDGRVDQSDFAVWKSQFGSWSVTAHLAADGNRDGAVDAADYSIWRNNRGAIAGDFDRDGQITAFDYAIWGSTIGSKTDLRADADGDGRIDDGDYKIWRTRYRQSLLAAPRLYDNLQQLYSPKGMSVTSPLALQKDATTLQRNDDRLKALDLALVTVGNSSSTTRHSNTKLEPNSAAHDDAFQWLTFSERELRGPTTAIKSLSKRQN